MRLDDTQQSPETPQGAPQSTHALSLRPGHPVGRNARPLPLHSSDSPVAPRGNVSRGPLSQLRRGLARLGRRTERMAPTSPVDTPPFSPAVTVRFTSTLPPRHPTPYVHATAAEPAPDGDVERQSIDDGAFLRSVSLSLPDPVENRMKQLQVQRTRLLQILKDWSWSPGESFRDQTVMGVLMNMKMAASPCHANAGVRRAGIHHLREELIKVDLEWAELAERFAVSLRT